MTEIIKLTAFGGTFLTTLPIFAIITNSYTIELSQATVGQKKEVDSLIEGTANDIIVVRELRKNVIS